MSVVESPKASGLVSRVQNILLKPAAEWDVIEAEPATVQGILVSYVAVLAAIPALATILSSLAFTRILLIPQTIGAVVSYVMAVVGVLVIGFIIDALAPSFGGQKNQVQAVKLVAYSYTASWVAGVALLIPILGGLIALAGGIYSLYLMYIGLPKLMKCPADKTMVYFLVSIAIAIAFAVVVSIILGIITVMVGVGAVATGAAALGGLH